MTDKYHGSIISIHESLHASGEGVGSLGGSEEYIEVVNEVLWQQ
jgi:hypothetical protein